VSGVILDEDNTGVANAKVTALPSPAVAYTDETGAFQFKNLPCGTYKMVVSAPGFEETQKDISITADDQTGLNIYLSTTNPLYTITGTVWGRATENVTINVYGTVSTQFQTNDARNFTLPSLPPGSYIIIPEAAGYSFFPAHRNVTIRKTTPRRISFFCYKNFRSSKY
jgi:hypothetical protein